MPFYSATNGVRIEPTSWVAARTQQDNAYVPGSCACQSQQALVSGDYVGAAEGRKTCHPRGKQVPGWSMEGRNWVDGPTSITEVVNQHNLGDQLRGRAVQHAVDGAQQGGPALIVEGDDDAGVGERLQVALAVAARERDTGDRERTVVKRTQACGSANCKSPSSPAFREEVKAGDTSVTAEPSPPWHPEGLPPIPGHTLHRGKYTRPKTTTANADGAALGLSAVHA